MSAGQWEIQPVCVSYLPRQTDRQPRLAQLDISQLVSPHLPAPPSVPADIQPLLQVLHVVRQRAARLKPLYFSHQILQEMIFPAGRLAVDNLVLLGQNELDDPLLLGQYETLERALDCEYEDNTEDSHTRLLSSNCWILITASLANLEFFGVKLSTD